MAYWVHILPEVQNRTLHLEDQHMNTDFKPDINKFMKKDKGNKTSELFQQFNQLQSEYKESKSPSKLTLLKQTQKKLRKMGIRVTV